MIRSVVIKGEKMVKIIKKVIAAEQLADYYSSFSIGK